MRRLLLSFIASLILLTALPTPPARAASGGVVMNFTEVDISTMVKFISELTGKNFVLDERVKGKISVFSPAKLTTDEAFALFTSVLELKGFTLVQSGKIYKVVPIASAKQAGTRLLGSEERVPISDAYLARVFNLTHISAQEALVFLQPIISKDGHIASFGPGNMLLVVDAATNLQKVGDILQLIDTSQRREGAEMVYLKHGSAEGIATVLREWLSGKGTRSMAPAAQQQLNTGSVQVIADVRLNALLLFGDEASKQDVRKMVALLDVMPPDASSKVNVYYLEHTDATDLAKVLEGVVKGMTAQAAGQPGATVAQASPFDSGKVTITADKATNSLVIMASPTDYTNLLQVIKKLDRRSKQVFVEVLIAEVSLDKSRELGLQSGVIGGAALNSTLGVAGMYDPLGTMSQLLAGLSAAELGNIVEARPVNITAMMKALDKNGLVNILSTPNILTTDNKEAEINVGENVPFKGSTTSLSGNSNATYESIERKDIGINLKIKPQISEGDYIRMDLYQEISAVKNDRGQAVDLVTTKRSAKTSVVVKDNETIVIGGLIQDTENVTEQKFPLLGDIPGLGWLFKTKTKTRNKTNLMIMLTPKVVKDPEDMARLSEAQRSKFTNATTSTGKLDVQQVIAGQTPPQQPPQAAPAP